MSQQYEKYCEKYAYTTQQKMQLKKADDEGLDPKLNMTFNKAQERPVNAALSNTFGFGGHNAVLAFKRWEA